MNFLRWFFRISWVSLPPVDIIECPTCTGYGQIDLVTRKPDKAATANTVGCDGPCGGMGVYKRLRADVQA